MLPLPLDAMANIFDQAPSSPFADPDADTLEARPSRSKKRPELTSSQRRAGQVKLLDMVEAAFHTLHEALEHADFSTAIKAAQIILDRSGFGPKSTVDVNNTHIDLSQLSKDELASRALRLAELLRASGREIPSNTIDVTPTSNRVN